MKLLIFVNAPNNVLSTMEVNAQLVRQINTSILLKDIAFHVPMGKCTTTKQNLVNVLPINKLLIRDVHVHQINLFTQRVNNASSVCIPISLMFWQWSAKHVLMGIGLKSLLEVVSESSVQETLFTVTILKHVHVQIKCLTS